MEGCKSILYSDCRHLTLSLRDSQTAGFLWTADTQDKLTGDSIYPQLAGGPVPPSLPLGVSALSCQVARQTSAECLFPRLQIRFLSGETYLGTSAFPTLQTDSLLAASVPAMTKRDQLVAAALLASTDDSGDPSMPVRRAMAEKLRLVKELREQLLDQRERERRKAARVDIA